MRYFREQGRSDHEVIEALNAKFVTTTRLCRAKW